MSQTLPHIPNILQSVVLLFQAVHCSLHGIKPPGFQWNIPASKLQEHMKLNIKYKATLCGVNETKLGKICSVELVSEEGECVRKTFISLGLAQTDGSPPLKPIEAVVKPQTPVRLVLQEASVFSQTGTKLVLSSFLLSSMFEHL